jgi:glycosyltransferase involved in cell wall biosynthesis
VRTATELAAALATIGIEVDDRAKTVVHIGDPASWRPVNGRTNIGFAWWPYSRVPESALRALYGVDVLLVPSAWCARGVTMPGPNQRVAIVPLGVNAHDFTVPDVARERGERLRLLAFDTRAASHDAGVDIAVEAFKRAFPERVDVTMDIWTTEVADFVRADPRVQIRRGVGDDRNLRALYHRFDALIYSARGAGFGFIPLEAMATGLPVFHSGQGAFEAFADLGELLGSREMKVPSRVHPHAICYEPYVDLVADRLLGFEAKYDEFQAQAAIDADRVRERFSWEASARRLLEVLEGRDGTGESSDVSERRDVPVAT